MEPLVLTRTSDLDPALRFRLAPLISHLKNQTFSRNHV